MPDNCIIYVENIKTGEHYVADSFSSNDLGSLFAGGGNSFARSVDLMNKHIKSDALRLPKECQNLSYKPFLTFRIVLLRDVTYAGDGTVASCGSSYVMLLSTLAVIANNISFADYGNFMAFADSICASCRTLEQEGRTPYTQADADLFRDFISANISNFNFWN